MPSKHLGAGSEEPPKVEGLLRLYSMQYCPYAQRARLVLGAKNIEYDTININLTNKPVWYFKINPEGKVPAILDGDKIIIESLDVADYIEEKYPNQNPLYPSDPEAKEREKHLIRTLLDPAISNFYKCLASKEEKTPEEWVRVLIEPLEPLERELAARGTPFFGGQKPGMLDYMLWPWAERARCTFLKVGQKLPLEEDQIPQLRKWKRALRQDLVVCATYEGPEIYYKLLLAFFNKQVIDYDNV